MNKTILITGANRGIGKAVALGLAADGYDIAVHCRSRRDEAEAVAAEICAQGRQARVLQFDVGDRAACREILSADVAAHGAYYGVVLNAGLTRDNAFPALEDEDWDNFKDDEDFKEHIFKSADLLKELGLGSENYTALEQSIDRLMSRIIEIKLDTKNKKGENDKKDYLKDFFNMEFKEIKATKSIIYSTPNKPTKMYLLKGDVVEILQEKDDWLQIRYYGNKTIEDWIKKSDVE